MCIFASQSNTMRRVCINLMPLLIALFAFVFPNEIRAQGITKSDGTQFKLYPKDWVNDINHESNAHRPHDEYRCYVIGGVFKSLSNAKSFLAKYRETLDVEKAFIFREPSELYYVAIDGPLKREDAMKLVAEINAKSEAQQLSGEDVWIKTK